MRSSSSRHGTHATGVSPEKCGGSAGRCRQPSWQSGLPLENCPARKASAFRCSLISNGLVSLSLTIHPRCTPLGAGWQLGGGSRRTRLARTLSQSILMCCWLRTSRQSRKPPSTLRTRRRRRLASPSDCSRFPRSVTPGKGAKMQAGRLSSFRRRCLAVATLPSP